MNAPEQHTPVPDPAAPGCCRCGLPVRAGRHTQDQAEQQPARPDMPRWRVEQCRSCHQPIIWAITDRTGRPMPVDAEPPLSGGTVALRPRGPDERPLAHVLTARELATTGFGRRDLRTSHLARCPQADKWRTRGRRTHLPPPG